MKSNLKQIQFDHFCPYELTKDENGQETEHIFDFTTLFGIIEKQPLHVTVRTIMGETYRFHVCHYRAKNDVWELQILHLREEALPGLATMEGDYQLIEIPEGKYLAESCTLMYSKASNTIYMQRNIYCLSPDRLTAFLSTFLPEGSKLYLKPIVSQQNIGKVNSNMLYRKVLLTVSMEELASQSTDKSLMSSLKALGKYQGNMLRLELGMGRKSGFLDSANVTKLVHEAYDSASVSRLKVSMSDPNDVGFSMIDLLDDRLTYVVSLEYSKAQPISHDRLFFACMEKFLTSN